MRLRLFSHAGCNVLLPFMSNIYLHNFQKTFWWPEIIFNHDFHHKRESLYLITFFVYFYPQPTVISPCVFFPFFLNTNVRSRNQTMYTYIFLVCMNTYTKFICTVDLCICRPCQTHFFLSNSRSLSNKDTTIILLLSACLP